MLAYVISCCYAVSLIMISSSRDAVLKVCWMNVLMITSSRLGYGRLRTAGAAMST